MLTVKRLEKTLPIRLQRRAYVDDNTLALSISYDNLCTTKLSLITDTEGGFGATRRPRRSGAKMFGFIGLVRKGPLPKLLDVTRQPNPPLCGTYFFSVVYKTCEL